MSANLARLGPVDDETDPAGDRRREARHSARATAWLVSSRGEREDASIIDVSNHGCAVRAEPGWLRAGGFVAVGISDNPPLRGIVRWRRDGAAGIEFLGAIPCDREEWHELMDGGGLA